MDLIKIVNARQTIDSFASKEDIGARLAYWMTKFVVKTESDHKFYVDELQKLLRKYGKENDDGNIVVPAESMEEFSKELTVLQNTDAEDPGIRFSLSELSSELKLSMQQMYTLLDFVDEDK